MLIRKNILKEIYEYDVYKLANQLSDKIWYDFENWDIKTQRTIGYQIIRSADSISANLAEGFGRYSNPDKNRFYIISRGSFEETKSWLRKLIRRNILTQKQANEYKEIIDELGPKLNAFIRSTKQHSK